MDQDQADRIEAMLKMVVDFIGENKDLLDRAKRWRRATPWASPTIPRRDDGHKSQAG